jgi:uncharacterized Zn-binding protein involved in type VI secretion
MPGGGLMSRVGDFTVAFGALLPGPVPMIGIKVNGLPPATMFTPVAPHPPCNPSSPDHCASEVLQSCDAVFVNKQWATFTGAETLCGHPIATGALGVNVKG